jgi:hypothetical protein
VKYKKIFEWVPGALSPELKRPVGEATDHLYPFANVKNDWSCTGTNPCDFFACVGEINFFCVTHDVVGLNTVHTPTASKR